MILDGTKIAESVLKNVSVPKNKKCKLAIIQVGENKVSEKYIQEKQKVCKSIGIAFELFLFPKTIDVKELKAKVKKIGEDSRNTGMIVQLPLPSKFPTQEILDCIVREKDIDVLSSASFGSFVLGTLPILPPTVCAISLLLKEVRITPKGKNVVVVGAGRLVGLPVALWLISQGATVSVLSSATKNLGFFTKNADVVISGVGKRGLISGSMVRTGAMVIDAGTSIEQGVTHGDVDFKSVSKRASYITPVPGGVGPLTVAFLLKNLSVLATIQK